MGGLFARGEGNPFFTEQLVAEVMAGGGLGGLPARLAELLTARVSDCGPQAGHPADEIYELPVEV